MPAVPGRDGRAGCPRQGALRRPGPRRLRRRAPGRRRARGPAGAAAPGRLPRARADPCRARGWPGPWPSGTPARWATCCDSPSRRATPQRRRPSRPGRPSSRRPRAGGPGAGGAAWGRPMPPGRPSSRGSPPVARPPRRGLPCRRRDPAADWPAALAEAARTALAGGRGRVLVVPDHRDVARVDAALAAARPRSARPPHGRPGPAGAVHRLAQGARGHVAGRRRHARRGLGAGA